MENDLLGYQQSLARFLLSGVPLPTVTNRGVILINMSSDLTQRTCVPCEGGVDSLKGYALDEYVDQIAAKWRVVEEHHLAAEFLFENFAQALEFTNQIGRIAEEEGHHPDLYLSWGRVEVKIWTHAIDGLSENDFILAAKIDQL